MRWTVAVICGGLACACGDNLGSLEDAGPDLVDASPSIDAAESTPWSPAIVLGEGDLPDIALDAEGNAIAMWVLRETDHIEIWWNRFAVGAGWGDAQMIHASAEPPSLALSFYGGRVAVEPDGDAVAVWREPDDQNSSLWASRYTVGSGWEEAELIEASDGRPGLPQVIVDPDGNAVAVWAQGGNLWANSYTVGAGWGTAELLESGDATARGPLVATQPNGEAIAVWRQYEPVGAGTNWSFSRFVPGDGWSAAAPIDTGLSGQAPEGALATNSAGDGVLVWRQIDGTAGAFCSIRASSYTVASGWSTTETLDQWNPDASSHPAVALDASSNAVAVWTRWSKPGGVAWAGTDGEDTSWKTGEMLHPGGTLLHSGSNAAGDVVGVWGRQQQIRTSFYARDSGWSASHLTPAADANDDTLRVAVDSAGRAILLWVVTDDNATEPLPRSWVFASRLE